MTKHTVVIPKLGESVKEVTLLQFHIGIGEYVEKGDIIAEVASDKVDSDVTASETGTILELCAEINTTIKVGTPLAIIHTESSSKEYTSTTDPSAEKEQVLSYNEPTFKRKHSPLVRSIAKEKNIPESELNTIIGTGTNGRIKKTDLLAYLEKVKLTSPRKKEEEEDTLPLLSLKDEIKPISVKDSRIIPMDRMRKLIANHMVQSVQTAPHVTCFIEVDMTPIVDWRENVKEKFQTKHQTKLTYMPIIIEALIQALIEFPEMNASIVGDEIHQHHSIHIGMATALPSNHLIVPVIKNADELNLKGLAKQVNNLALKARKSQLNSDEIKGSTFTISNVGAFGSEMGTPIINQPEVGILATGIIKKKPVAKKTELGYVSVIRDMMYLSLSFDHRAIDGALGGTFLRRIGDILENFDQKTLY